MNLLLDVLVELVGASANARSERTLVGAFAFAAALLLSATGVVMLAVPPPFWGFGLHAGSVIVGGLGLFLALVHWNRNAEDPRFAAFCAIISSAAVAFPFLSLLI